MAGILFVMENPYQSPKSSLIEPAAASPTRQRARSSLRMAFIILLAPAIYNYVAFDAQAIASGGIHPSFAMLYRLINIAGFVIGGGLIWLVGLPLVELLARGIRFALAKNTNLTAWNETLYRSVNGTVFLAVPGAIVWAIWVFGFYSLKVDFVLISWAVGVPAHLLGAGLYLPLLFRWYKLARNV